jgi:hypothetical protein
MELAWSGHRPPSVLLRWMHLHSASAPFSLQWPLRQWGAAVEASARELVAGTKLGGGSSMELAAAARPP